MATMIPVPGHLRLTVLGCSNAVPYPDAASAGFLVEWETTALLLDIGQGVAERLAGVADAKELAGIVVGHMHADHFVGLAHLRYLFPWAGNGAALLPVHLPPDGRERLDELASSISERPGFFDASFAVEEYDPAAALAVGPLTLRFARSRHYVPAWAMSVEAPDGARLVYTGDTGPSDAMVEFARGADLLLVEATLRDPSEDDEERGHLTTPEAIDLASTAEVAAALLVHYPPDRRAEIEHLCAATGPWIGPAAIGQTVIVAPGIGRAATPVGTTAAARDRTVSATLTLGEPAP
jgi:ribonuclease BN (tRNA processing enzyme)